MSTQATLERITAGNPALQALLQQYPSECELELTPFYARHRVMKLIAMLPYHPQVMRHVDDGVRATPLHVLEDLYALNTKEGLRLSLQDVPAYLRLVLKLCNGGRFRLIERAFELPCPWPSSPSRQRVY